MKRTKTLRQVALGLLSFDRTAGDWPEEWLPGGRHVARLYLFHVLPLWKHTIVVRQVDETQRVIRSEEHGGPITRWTHEIRVIQGFDGMCQYTDEIEMDAGLLTPVVWLFAQGFYRYRQRRWRRVVVAAL